MIKSTDITLFKYGIRGDKSRPVSRANVSYFGVLIDTSSLHIYLKVWPSLSWYNW